MSALATDAVAGEVSSSTAFALIREVMDFSNKQTNKKKVHYCLKNVINMFFLSSRMAILYRQIVSR